MVSTHSQYMDKVLLAPWGPRSWDSQHLFLRISPGSSNPWTNHEWDPLSGCPQKRLNMALKTWSPKQDGTGVSHWSSYLPTAPREKGERLTGAPSAPGCVTQVAPGHLPSPHQPGCLSTACCRREPRLTLFHCWQPWFIVHGELRDILQAGHSTQNRWIRGSWKAGTMTDPSAYAMLSMGRTRALYCH